MSGGGGGGGEGGGGGGGAPGVTKMAIIILKSAITHTPPHGSKRSTWKELFRLKNVNL